LSSDQTTELINALNRIIGPLARLCIRQKISNSELEEMIRLAFVEAALTNHQNGETEITNNRIGVLTGLNRKEVSRLKSILDEGGSGLAKMPPSRTQKIVNGWMNDKEFRDSKKRPRTLPILNRKDGVEYGSFKALVNRYGSDLRYLGILQEMLIDKVVESDDKEHITLVNHAYIPHKNEIEKVGTAAKHVADLFNTALYNLDQKEVETKRYQRQVAYSQIDERYAGELEELIKLNAQELLEMLAAELNKKRKQSKRTSNGKKKTIGFGVYYIEKDLDNDND